MPSIEPSPLAFNNIIKRLVHLHQKIHLAGWTIVCGAGKNCPFLKLLGHTGNMRVLYFTDGAGIDLLSIRESLLRIPEVITSIRHGQEQAKYVDLMQVMTLADQEFRCAPTVLRTLLINLVQRGLHQRWVNRNHRADLLVRRINYRSYSEVQAAILSFCASKKDRRSVATNKLQLLHFTDKIEITIIGPGFDDIERWLRKDVSLQGVQVVIKDVIESDPQLDWFWPHVRESVMADSALLA